MRTKNILYFSRTFNKGGTEKVIMQLCGSFKDEFNKIVVCSNGGIGVSVLNEMNIKHYNISDINDKSIKTIVKNMISLIKIIKKEDINIIHTHHRMAAFYICFLSYFIKFDFINTAHNTFHNKKLLTKFSLNKANTIAVGESVKENLCNYFKIPENKVNVILNGIENNHETMMPIKEIQEVKEKGYFVVGNIGRLSKQKGIEYYLEAIPKVIKKHPYIKFFVIGGGHNSEIYKKDNLDIIVNKLGIEKNIIFLGFRNDIFNVIKQLDLVVLSSLWEGLPLTPMETFSQGKTIIATSVDGTPEVVKDKYNGLLIKPQNSEDISDAIIYLYEHREIMNELEHNALKTYLDNFTVEHFVNSYRQFYIQNTKY